MRRSRVMQRDTCAATDDVKVASAERGWQELVANGISVETSAAALTSEDAAAAPENGRSIVAEVDHFHPLRAR